MYGFGAKLPPFYNIVSHCFACSGNIFDPFIYGGVNELIRMYFFFFIFKKLLVKLICC